MTGHLIYLKPCVSQVTSYQPLDAHCLPENEEELNRGLEQAPEAPTARGPIPGGYYPPGRSSSSSHSLQLYLALGHPAIVMVDVQLIRGPRES